MVLWFAGGACLLVWLVFHDPAIDYRLVMLGALVPDLGDAPLGGARVFHSLVAAVAILVVVMLATVHRRRVRRRLLALPIGVFLHLVLDGAWTSTRTFWWPFLGTSLPRIAIPSAAHPVALTCVEEAAGAAVLVWGAYRFRLVEPDRRAHFLRTGHLGRDLAAR